MRRAEDAEHSGGEHEDLARSRRRRWRAARVECAGVDATVEERGADNVVRAFLRVSAGDRVALLSWRAAEASALLSAALERAGAVVVPIALESIPESFARNALERAMGDARRSILAASHGIPPPLSMAALELARRSDRVHLHLTRIDPRLFSQSFRADPERIALLNEKIIHALASARTLHVRSTRGTELSVELSSRFALLAADGRPSPGRADNLPSGHVMTHPARVDGTLVADRLAVGAIRVGKDVLRRSPLTVKLVAGAVSAIECSDAATRDEVERYLASHENAGRVGLVTLPTHYLVRAESGIEVQDALLPGLGLGLGYTHHEHTRAPFACPVQLRLSGRGQSVWVDGGARLVDDGRWRDEWVGGIDPFR